MANMQVSDIDKSCSPYHHIFVPLQFFHMQSVSLDVPVDAPDSWYCQFAIH